MKTISRILMVGLMATASSVAAHDGNIASLEKCASIEDSITRLECFDKTTAGILALSGDDKVSGSKWTASASEDPLTDEPIHTVMLMADSGAGRFGDSVALVVRCKDNKTEMYIHWSSYLGSDDIVVTYRIDKEPAVTSTWNISTEGRASFSPPPIPILKQMMSSSTFVAQVTPRRENPITAIFDIQGAEEALADLREACNW